MDNVEAIDLFPQNGTKTRIERRKKPYGKASMMREYKKVKINRL